LHALPEEGGYSKVVFSADGRVMAVAVSSTQVRLRETSTWKELVTLEWPVPYPQSSGALSPDGGRLVLTSDGVILLWDLRTVRDGLATMGLDWSNVPGPTVGDNDTAGWGPPRLLHLEQNVTLPAR
jgi:WD40 repeat protein